MRQPRLWLYLSAPLMPVPRMTPTCRVKRWAHDNAFTLTALLATSVLTDIVVVLTCH